ncbi:MAG: metal-sulfur cluster assembly factor [Rickettsiales bacterium]|jgi:FeS assembly SUF system protein|nr:metal-sulfur cluster assembly factor [Rickettsiales bacterium]
MQVSKEQIINAIKTIPDPDVGIDLYSLGLIYDIDIKESGDVDIKMTLTSPTCPYANVMPKLVALAVSDLQGVKNVDVKLVWEPAWEISMMSDDAKFELDLT